MFQRLRDQDKEDNDERRKHFPDGQRGHQGDAHRQFHRHPAGRERRHGFSDDGIAPDNHAYETNDIETEEDAPRPDPVQEDADPDEGDAGAVGPAQAMLMHGRGCIGVCRARHLGRNLKSVGQGPAGDQFRGTFTVLGHSPLLPLTRFLAATSDTSARPRSIPARPALVARWAGGSGRRYGSGCVLR